MAFTDLGLGEPLLRAIAEQHYREPTPVQAAAIRDGLRSLLGQPRRAWDNPYGDGRAGERIARLLAGLPLDAALLEKTNRY